MKAPRILRYDWEDLTSSEEIDNWFVDDIRRTLLLIKANCGQDRSFLQNLFERQAGYLLTCPGSDLAVILYRLLKPLPEETLKTTLAIDIQMMPELEHSNLSMLQFMQIVEDSYALKPMPIVSGKVPRIDL